MIPPPPVASGGGGKSWTGSGKYIGGGTRDRDKSDRAGFTRTRGGGVRMSRPQKRRTRRVAEFIEPNFGDGSIEALRNLRESVSVINTDNHRFSFYSFIKGKNK
jgi:hypothetical protein|tara:strand:+ start:161 stop:472 length:312 start_codon:yes stop_codon:yes gene_type:complete